MSYKTTGTASSHTDLLDKLRTWLTGTAGWTQNAWTGSNLNIQGPGSGSGRTVNLNITALSYPVDGVYCWQVDGSVGYDSSALFGNQSGEGTPVFFNLWQNSISYWFYANDRRVIVVAKCSTLYISLYAGFFLPWCQPAQYPFPLAIMGDYYTRTPYNTVNAGRRMCCDPGWSPTAMLSAGVVRDPQGVWQPITNQSVSNSNDYATGYQRGRNYFAWPYSAAQDYPNALSWAGGTFGGSAGGVGVMDLMVPTAQSERLILPVHLNGTRDPALGALDGIYAPLGSGLSTEQVITAGGKTLRAFQNIHRLSANDFFLVDET